MPDTYHVREVDADAVQPLRTEILRDWGPDRLCVYEEDDDEDTHHFAVVSGERGDAAGSIYAVVTFVRHPLAGRSEPAYQLRGMAVDEDVQGEGLGTLLVEASLPKLALAEPDAGLLWCNARQSAITFYQRLGFEGVGAIFEIEDIGPHLRMWREIPTVTAG